MSQAFMKLRFSSRVRNPPRSRWPSSLAIAHSMLVVTWIFGISIEKNAAEPPWRTTLRTTFSANEVLCTQMSFATKLCVSGIVRS